MRLSHKQQLFTRMLGLLLHRILFRKGYEVTLGRGHVPGAKVGSGAFSCHHHKLAVDLNLFIDGEYQTGSDAYLELGEHWESLGGSWGGRFDDGNHFSLEHGGVR